jgi:hypothetical protein
VEHDTQERSVDLKPTVVLDESELPEFVHEKINSRASGWISLTVNSVRDPKLEKFVGTGLLYPKMSASRKLAD